MQHFRTIYNENIHTFGKSAIQGDQRETFQDIFIDILSFFTPKNHRIKNIFYNRECLHPFSVRKSVGLPLTIFHQLSDPGYSIQTSRRHHLFSHVLKPDELTGAF